MHFTRIGGVGLNYAFHQAEAPLDGPTLVFVNSLGTDFRIWNEVVSRLKDKFSILLYDKRGHGLSDLGATPYSIGNLVDEAAGLIEHLGIQKIVPCGLSVGGLVAQGLAARLPAKVERLILCDTAHKIGTRDMWNGRIASIETGGIEALAEPILERWFTPHFRENRPDELAGYRNMLVRQPKEGYIATCVALRGADNTALVEGLSVPTLCVAGDQDGSTPPDLVRSMADLIAGARFEIIENAGHIPCVEQPDALAALIEDFLNEGVTR